MSRKSEARHSVVVANDKLGGAYATLTQRKAHCRNFVNWAFANGHIFNSLRDVTFESVKAFIKSRLEDGVSISTLHNRLSSIRRSMSALGADPAERNITSAALGLGSRDRRGTKEPVPDDVFLAALDKAQAAGHPGFVIMLKIERLLGHRGLEALMSIRDLEQCALEASEATKLWVPVSNGTKSGRYRETSVILARAEETLIAIREALVYAHAHKGFLLEGGKDGLKSARAKYHRLARDFGLVGKHSPHSLRYAYVVEKIIEMRDAGLNRQEAMSMAAMFLGHGARRARYISMVYGRSIVATLKTEKRRPRMRRAIEKLNELIAAKQIQVGKT